MSSFEKGGNILKMTNFQKLISLLLFVITFSSIYYFFVFLPNKERAGQKRIEQIKAYCWKDLRWKLDFLNEAAKSKGVSNYKGLSSSEQDHVYKLCLHRNGL